MIKTMGIVAEYNPFHNGHKALLDFAKQQGYHRVIAVMSGNFVQRNQPAITEKRLRTQVALEHGVDLVLELPLPYATATAEKFAFGAVSLLHATQTVDALCFGSEVGTLKPLQEIVTALGSATFSQYLATFLQTGVTFAQARSCALSEILGESYGEIAKHPNNILGISYLSALEQLHWEIPSYTLPRQGVAHHSHTPQASFASASWIRSQTTQWEEIAPFVPPDALEKYQQGEQLGLYPTDLRLLNRAVLAHLRKQLQEDFLSLPDCSEGIENRLYKGIQQGTSLEEVEQLIKTKRYPMSRVRRLLWNSFLGITQEDVNAVPPYLRVLGANKNGFALLKQMGEKALLPTHHSLSYLEKQSKTAERFAFLEAQATDLFTLTLPKVFPCGYDYHTPAVFLKE